MLRKRKLVERRSRLDHKAFKSSLSYYLIFKGSLSPFASLGKYTRECNLLVVFGRDLCYKQEFFSYLLLVESERKKLMSSTRQFRVCVRFKHKLLQGFYAVSHKKNPCVFLKDILCKLPEPLSHVVSSVQSIISRVLIWFSEYGRPLTLTLIILR